MRKRRKLIRTVVSVLGAIVVCVLLVNIFKVTKIDCQTQFGVCSSQIEQELSPLSGKFIFLRLPQDRASEILSKFIQVKSVRVSRKLPKTLRVDVVLRSPIGAVVGTNESNVYGLVDEDGKVISIVSETNMSILLVKDWLPSITQLAPIHVSALKVLGSISEMEKKRVNGEVNELGLVVNSNGAVIIVDPKMPILDWYSSLQVIMDRSKIQNKIPHKIDLRFNQPVLEY